MCHARVSEPRRAGSNIKVLNDDSISNALDPSASQPPERGCDDAPDAKGRDGTRGVKKQKQKHTSEEAIWCQDRAGLR